MSNAERPAARRYRLRPPEVEAIQFLGTGESCSAVTDFLGGPHALGHRWNTNTLTGGSVAHDQEKAALGEPPHLSHLRWLDFRPGYWIVRTGALLRVIRDEDFQRVYEEVEQ